MLAVLVMGEKMALSRRCGHHVITTLSCEHSFAATDHQGNMELHELSLFIPDVLEGHRPPRGLLILYGCAASCSEGHMTTSELAEMNSHTVVSARSRGTCCTSTALRSHGDSPQDVPHYLRTPQIFHVGQLQGGRVLKVVRGVDRAIRTL